MSGAHHVYANDLEIASRSSDGKSTAMGDVCFTPPAPAKVGVPVPYSNTARAKDIRNGSRTVFIVGKEIALSDKSYFHTSTGNEPATSQYQQGIVSQVITGRAYFHTWSPNVKVEGEGVARHTDLVSHNHNNPANTALFPFISRGWRGRHVCKRQEQEIEKACNDDDKKTSGRPRKRARPSPLGAKNNAGASNSGNSGPQSWQNQHCGGLLQVLNNAQASDINKALESANKELQDLQDHLRDYTRYAEQVTKAVEEYAAAQGVKLAVKAGAKQVAGTFVPGAGNAVMGLWTAYDVAQLSAEVASRYSDITGMIDDIKAIDDSIKKVTEMKDRIEGLAQGEPLIIDGSKDSGSKVLGDLQETLALTSRCLRARKCSLVPFSSKSHIGSRARADQVQTSESNSGGCCPGQTGHHLIPGSLIKPRPGKDQHGCKDYNHAAAPVVCVESTNQHSGSHKRVHDALDAGLQHRVDISESPGWFDRPPVRDGAMSMDEAIKAAAESHARAFPLSGCSKKCIEAQLKDYYNKHCRRANVRVQDKQGGDILPDFGGDD